jgi:4-hydroxy-2-oxoheptanedioate aldolase
MNNLKRQLAAGQTVRVFLVGALPLPALVELAGQHGGFHGVWLDQEHPGTPIRELDTLVLACRAWGMDSFVRLAPTDYATVMRPLETGAGGVMAAQVRSVAETRQFVRWAQYPPDGIRGVNPLNREGGYGAADYARLAEANRERWLAVQIETAEALADVEAIARVPGVDHLFVGPVDLSFAPGVPGDFMHPVCIAALERIAAAAAGAGISWGVLAQGADHAALCQRLGCRLFCLAGDIPCLRLGLAAATDRYAAMFDVGEH